MKKERSSDDASQIMINPKDYNIVRNRHSNNKLTHLMTNIGDVKARNNEMHKASDMIVCRIKKGLLASSQSF